MSKESVPFVGRGAQLAEMRAYGHLAFERNQGKVLFLTGEAGIGKTTLGERFSQIMQDHYPKMRYAYACCSEKTSDISPYTPFIQLHQSLLEQEAFKNKQEFKESWLLEYAKEISPDFFDLVPIAGPLLKFAFKSTTFIFEKQHTQRRKESAGTEQVNIFQRFTNSLRYIAHRNPLLLFIDDWHWADESSTNLLFYLSRQLADVPILFLVTYRPHEAQARQHPILEIHTEMQRYNLCVSINLDFLTLEAVTEYLAIRFTSARFDNVFVKWLFDTTNGNPLFLKEYIELLLQDHLLTPKGKLFTNWQQIDPPDSVEAVIHSRIHYLDADALELLTYASIEGEHFSTLLLERALGMKRLSILKRLRMIEHTHQLISELGQQTKYHQQVIVYKFVHILVYQALYNELSKGEKVELSRVFLEVQSEIFEDADEVTRNQMLPQLINLAEAAAEYEARAKYALQAAQEAEKSYAHVEVLKHCRLGLLALDNLPSTSNTEELRIRLLIRQAFTYWWYIGNLSKALDILHNAESIAKKSDKSEFLLAVYNHIGSIHSTRGDYDQALEQLYKAVDIGKKNQIDLIWIYHKLSDVYDTRGDFQQAIEWSQQALSLAEKSGNQIDLVYCYLQLGIIYGSNGEYEKGSALHDKAIAVAEKLSNESVLREVYNQAALMRILAHRDYDQALLWLEKAVKINEKMGDKLVLAVNYHNIASIYRSLKEYDQALEWYQKVAMIREKASDLRNLAITWHAMGTIAMDQGELNKALDFFNRSRDMFIQINLPNNVTRVEESIEKVRTKLAAT